MFRKGYKELPTEERNCGGFKVQDELTGAIYEFSQYGTENDKIPLCQ